MSTLQAITQLASSSDTGIFDLINTKAIEARATLITVSGAIGVAYTMYRAVIARFALGAVVIAAITVAVFVWVINNVGVLQDRVGHEVNGLGTSISVPSVPDPPGPAPAREAS